MNVAEEYSAILQKTIQLSKWIIEDPIIAPLVKKFLFFDGTCRSSTFFKSLHHFSASWRTLIPVHSLTHHLSPIIISYSVVRLLLYLCCSVYCLCVNVYCHWVTTQLQLINISYLLERLISATRSLKLSLSFGLSNWISVDLNCSGHAMYPMERKHGRWRRKTKLCLFLKGKYLEEYMVLNMKMGNGKVGGLEYLPL